MEIILNADFEEGTTNLGGLTREIFYAKASDVKLIPAPVDYAAGGITVTTAITCKTGKQFGRIYVTADTGQVTDKEVGEKDGGSFETELDFFHPRISEQLLKLKRLFSNGGFIFLATDGNGVMRIVGSLDHPAYRVAAEAKTGMAPKDRNGGNFKMVAASATPALIYTGVVPLTPGI